MNDVIRLWLKKYFSAYFTCSVWSVTTRRCSIFPTFKSRNCIGGPPIRGAAVILCVERTSVSRNSSKISWKWNPTVFLDYISLWEWNEKTNASTQSRYIPNLDCKTRPNTVQGWRIVPPLRSPLCLSGFFEDQGRRHERQEALICTIDSPRGVMFQILWWSPS